jgi:hypothetical protein
MLCNNDFRWFVEKHFRSTAIPLTDQQIMGWMAELATTFMRQCEKNCRGNRDLMDTMKGMCDIRVVNCQQCAVPNCFIMSCTLTNEGLRIVDERRINKSLRKSQ